eukprot:4729525-Alexandrium_andersonii.AAC.1
MWAGARLLSERHPWRRVPAPSRLRRVWPAPFLRCPGAAPRCGCRCCGPAQRTWQCAAAVPAQRGPPAALACAR